MAPKRTADENYLEDETWLGPNLDSTSLPSTSTLPPPGASNRPEDAFSPVEIQVQLPRSPGRSRKDEEDLIGKMRRELEQEEEEIRIEERIRKLRGDDETWLGAPPSELQIPKDLE